MPSFGNFGGGSSGGVGNTSFEVMNQQPQPGFGAFASPQQQQQQQQSNQVNPSFSGTAFNERRA